jgi:hypothetical protein
MAANMAQVLEVQQVAKECKKFFMEVWMVLFYSVIYISTK